MEIIILTIAVTFILVGMLTKFYPPQKINSWYGYRTGLSRQSQKHWDFAQSLSSRLMLLFGVLLMSYWMILSTMKISLPEYVDIIALLSASLFPIILTQQALKKI